MTTDTLVELPSLEFVAPFPGFPGKTRFALVSRDDAGLLYELRSLDEPSLRFLVVPPAPFFPEYAPEIENEVFAALNTKDPDRLLVMVVITAGVNETTANLLAPIIVDRDSRRAMQVVLNDSNLPVRAIMRRDY
jgi:flagellar assembly factor FliW